MITFLLAILLLTVLFIVFWAVFIPDDESISSHRTFLIGAKGGKAKKEVEDDTIIEDDLV